MESYAAALLVPFAVLGRKLVEQEVVEDLDGAGVLVLTQYEKCVAKDRVMQIP